MLVGALLLHGAWALRGIVDAPLKNVVRCFLASMRFLGKRSIGRPIDDGKNAVRVLRRYHRLIPIVFHLHFELTVQGQSRVPSRARKEKIHPPRLYKDGLVTDRDLNVYRLGLNRADSVRDIGNELHH